MTDSKKDATLATLAMAPSSTAPAVSTDSSTTKSSSSADNGRGGSTLAVALREVVEDLFSPSKLAVHPVLSGTLNTQGSVPLPVLAQLAEIQAAWSTAKKTSGGKKGEGGKEEGRELSAEGGQDVVGVLVEAVQMSRLVQLSDDGGGARPRVARSTIIARELPPAVTEADVRALFQKWAEAVLEVRCEHGLWYIKLAGEDDAKAAFQALNGTPVEGQPLRLRIRPEVGQAVYGGFTPQSNTGPGAHMGGGAGRRGGGGGRGRERASGRSTFVAKSAGRDDDGPRASVRTSGNAACRHLSWGWRASATAATACAPPAPPPPVPSASAQRLHDDRGRIGCTFH
ncbi:la-related protein 4, partial [Nannochloropsis gaditana]